VKVALPERGGEGEGREKGRKAKRGYDAVEAD
jgi:hypothetical protein